MIAGMNISQLVTKLQEDAKAKRDFIVNTSRAKFVAKGEVTGIEFDFNREGTHFTNNRLFEAQVAGKVGIPTKYWDKMRQEAPELLERNVNHWFHAKPEARMIRTLKGSSRAFLSKGYRIIDDIEMVSNVLPRLHDAGWEVKSSQITEQRMYIQLVSPKLTKEVKVGDVVQAGIAISNSEVGCGFSRFDPLIYCVKCTNGMIAAEGLLKRHLGRAYVEGLEDSMEIFQDETKKKVSAALWAQINDFIDQVISEESFNLLVNRMQEATTVKVDCPTEAVEIVQKRYNMTDDERDSILNNLIQEGDRSQFGLVNAITAMANVMEDYDRGIEIERIGGKVLELPSSDVLFEK